MLQSQGQLTPAESSHGDASLSSHHVGLLDHIMARTPQLSDTDR